MSDLSREHVIAWVKDERATWVKCRTHDKANGFVFEVAEADKAIAHLEAILTLLQSAETRLTPICATGEEALAMADTLLPLTDRPDDVCFSPHNLVVLALRDSCRRSGVAHVLNGVLSAIKRIEVVTAERDKLRQSAETVEKERDQLQRDAIHLNLRADAAEHELDKAIAERDRLTQAVERLKGIESRAWYANTTGTCHSTACLIWGEDGGLDHTKPHGNCNCGALVNFQRARAEKAEAEVTRLTERWAALGLWLEGEDTRTIGREDDHGKGQNLICEMAKDKMDELETQR